MRDEHIANPGRKRPALLKVAVLLSWRHSREVLTVVKASAQAGMFDNLRVRKFFISSSNFYFVIKPVIMFITLTSRYYFSAVIGLLFFVLINTLTCSVIYAQPDGSSGNGRSWHNVFSTVRYQPDGCDFVIYNGNKRFNRALYGTNTGFRVETGDLPEFALYMPGMGGNLKLGIAVSDTSMWLTDADNIEARYRPGTMIYEISDSLLGEGKITLAVHAMADAEGVIVKITARQVPAGCRLYMAFGGATGKRFSREGDIGADPETVFYLKPEYCKDNEFFTNGNSFSLYYGSG
ncbi:MAG: DUF4450 domain-containing protein, partial [Bacteroidales bacterium]